MILIALVHFLAFAQATPISSELNSDDGEIVDDQT